MSIYRLMSVVLFVGMSLLLSSCSNSDNHIVSFMHANINCSDLARSRDFYEMLGFTAVMEGDSEVTAEFAAALNMPPYSISFTQMLSRDGSLIDLIEWKDPYDDSVPYSSVNHLGIAFLTLETTNLDADIVILAAQGVEFFSEPASMARPSGNKRFICFKDLDGTIIELVETGSVKSPAASGIHITGIMGVTINCSDYEQSLAFYEKLGFTSVIEIDELGTPETAAALGIPSYHVRGSVMKLKGGGTTLNLLKWEDPFDNSRPYAQLNHLGIARVALMSTDLEADFERLKAEGMQFYSEPVMPEGPLSFLSIVCLQDPDGTVIELAELFPGLKRKWKPGLKFLNKILSHRKVG